MAAKRALGKRKRTSRSAVDRKAKLGSHPQGSGWPFVNVSNAVTADDAELRKTVRAHAARHYWKGQMKHEVHDRKDPNGPSSTPLPQIDTPGTKSHVPAAVEQQTRDWEDLWHPTSVKDRTYLDDWVWLNEDGQAESQSPQAMVLQHAMNLTSQGSRSVISSDVDFHSSLEYPTLAPSPQSLIVSGTADPFDSFPLKGCPRYPEILHHFTNNIVRSILPVDRGVGIDDSWMPMIMYDPLLFQATINFAAAHIDILHGVQNQCKGTQKLQMKAKTIMMINERLNSSDTAVSNSSIGAVAMLAAAERTGGNIKELRVHEAALGKMVRLRGGLQRLACDVLQMFLSWGDLLTSAMLATRPQFAPPTYCTGSSNFSDASLPIPSDRLEPFHNLNLLSSVFQGLRDLTAQMPPIRYKASRITEADMLAFTKARSSILYFLACFAPTSDLPNTIAMDSEESIDGSLSMSSAFEAHRLAALIYANLVLCYCAANGGSLRSIKSQLIAAILAGEEDVSRPLSEKPLAMWIYFMGGLLALDPGEEEFFAIRIVGTLRRTGRFNWEEIEEFLKRILWVDMLSNMAWKSLWPRVQSLLD